MSDSVMNETDQPLTPTLTGPIARLMLNRPSAGNAIDLPMARALRAAAAECSSNAAVRCVVLTGAGRLFCAGGDVGLLGAAGAHCGEVLGALAQTLHEAILHLARMRKPLLVLVNGPAAGAGLSLALLGDVVLAARSAHFTAAYGAIGLTPDGGMSWQLPRLIGLRKAQEMILTNRRVAAVEAAAIGLVTRVVEDSQLTHEGAAIAASLASAATAALGAARQLLRHSFTRELDLQLDEERAAIIDAGNGPESREGISAFLAKRPPSYPAG